MCLCPPVLDICPYSPVCQPLHPIILTLIFLQHWISAFIIPVSSARIHFLLSTISGSTCVLSSSCAGFLLCLDLSRWILTIISSFKIIINNNNNRAKARLQWVESLPCTCLTWVLSPAPYMILRATRSDSWVQSLGSNFWAAPDVTQKTLIN